MKKKNKEGVEGEKLAGFSRKLNNERSESADLGKLKLFLPLPFAPLLSLLGCQCLKHISSCAGINENDEIGYTKSNPIV
jgi:uncharacterized membrane protein